MSLIEHQFEEKHERNQLSRDAEKLLELAEEFQDRCERYDRKLFVFSFFGLAGSVGMGAIGGVGAIQYYASNTSIAISIGTIGLAYAFAWMGYSLVMHKRISALYRRERRALESIVDMLREIEQSMAEQDGMSAIERAEFKIRLARFDIGCVDG